MSARRVRKDLREQVLEADGIAPAPDRGRSVRRRTGAARAWTGCHHAPSTHGRRSGSSGWTRCWRSNCGMPWHVAQPAFASDAAVRLPDGARADGLRHGRRSGTGGGRRAQPIHRRADGNLVDSIEDLPDEEVDRLLAARMRRDGRDMSADFLDRISRLSPKRLALLAPSCTSRSRRQIERAHETDRSDWHRLPRFRALTTRHASGRC